MTKQRLYASSLLLLLATTPWGLGGDAEPVLLGLPGWAVYSLALTVVYAASLAWWLGRYWELSAKGTEPDDGDMRGNQRQGGGVA